MNNPGRRKFIKLISGGSALIAASGLMPVRGKTADRSKVVIIGGGFGGSTCARYLHRFDNNLEITLVEPSQRYITCPFSNTVISGILPMDFITHDYN